MRVFFVCLKLLSKQRWRWPHSGSKLYNSCSTATPSVRRVNCNGHIKRFSRQAKPGKDTSVMTYKLYCEIYSNLLAAIKK